MTIKSDDTDCVTTRRTGRQETASRILAAACVVWWFVPATAAMAQADCDEWNTRAFFEKVAASGVTRCVAEFGAKTNVRDGHGTTPLHLAAGSSETPAALAALLDAGADPKARAEMRWTPLHMAAALLDAGANPGAKDAQGKIPWDLISDDSPLKGTDAYWQLHEGRFE